MAWVVGTEPEGGEERRQGNPSDPSLVEGSETKGEKETAENGGQPGPKDAEKGQGRWKGQG